MAKRLNVKSLAAAVLLAFVALVGTVLVAWPQWTGPLSVRFPLRSQTLEAFASCSELRDALVETGERQGFAGIAAERAVPSASTPQAAGIGGAGGTRDYTRTNVQVEGVDEADIVKTDGNYLYLVNQGAVRIVRASPQENAELLATIPYRNATPQDLFLHGDYLAVIGQREPESYPYPGGVEPQPLGILGVPESFIAPDFWYNPVSFVEVFNVSDRAQPALVRTVEFQGTTLTSRKINEVVYLVLSTTPPVAILEGKILSPNASPDAQSAAEALDDALLPKYREAIGALDSSVAFSPFVGCTGVAYPPTILDGQYLTVAGFPLDQPQADILKSVVLGSGTTVYASPTTLYVAGTDYGYTFREPQPLRSIGFPVPPTREETIIHAFALTPQAISYQGNGRVPGHALNQFSMDEHGGNFRIATTIGETWFGPAEDQQRQSESAVYILDKSLRRAGAIEGIAPGETIYSARFMGERAYLVTFKKIDPFFVLDLADPQNPRILGKLKIPGYSDYLHPYDANHIIGVGKNAEDAAEGDFAWYQGIKMALFDVTDPEHPRELHKVDIGDRGTDSPALHNHKAFLFDPSRNLLVLPILLAEIDDSKQSPEFEEVFLRGSPSTRLGASQYGDFVYQGSYIYELTPEKGFVFRGRVTHLDNPVAYFLRTGYYPGESDLFIQRNLRIGDNLYSISDGKVLINALSDLSKKAEVKF